MIGTFVKVNTFFYQGYGFYLWKDYNAKFWPNQMFIYVDNCWFLYQVDNQELIL